MSFPSSNKQQGIVIVVALFIVALVATLSFIMLSRFERDTRRTTLLVHAILADAEAEGSVAWAMDTLRNDWEKQKPTQLIDPTPIQLPLQHEDGFDISTTIDDMQGRFNLNNLTDIKSQFDFIHLLVITNPSLSHDQALAIVSEIVKVISARPFISVSELRLIKDITPAIFDSIEDNIIALPATTLINVQSAPLPVLASLSDTMTLDAAKQIDALRKGTPIINPSVFLNWDVVKNHAIDGGKITVSSQYFLVTTTVSIENQRTILYTLLSRTAGQDKDKDKVQLNILWQSKGTW